jgi:hypothetical protein
MTTATTHPMIQGLFQTLPPAGDPWPPEKREAWLALAAGIFDTIYTERY